jgi:hypothetical protein
MGDANRSVCEVTTLGCSRTPKANPASRAARRVRADVDARVAEGMSSSE